MNKQPFFLLGLCQRAGKLVSGESMCEKTIQNGSAKLIIVAKDASDNTKKNFLDASKYYHVPISFFGTKESLGKAIGKEYRASLVVIDANLSKKLKQYIEAEEV